MTSPGEAAASKKGLLLRRSRAAEDRIAMREAAEAADDVGVILGKGQTFLVAGGADQGKTALLIGQIFRVHEW